MSATIVRKLVDKFYENYQTVHKTQLHTDICYYKKHFFSYRMGRHDPHIQIKDSEHDLIEFIYVPNSKERYYMNYDKRADSVTFYLCKKDYASVFFSSPVGTISFKNVQKLCTEEGHFQQMTVQDCSGIDIQDAIKILDMVQYIKDTTKGYRDGTIKN